MVECRSECGLCDGHVLGQTHSSGSGSLKGTVYYLKDNNGGAAGDTTIAPVIRYWFMQEALVGGTGTMQDRESRKVCCVGFAEY